jgi:hypothetical protein
MQDADSSIMNRKKMGWCETPVYDELMIEL